MLLRVQLGHVGDDSLQLRFPPEYADEIITLLDDNDVRHGTALELSADVTEWIEVVRVLDPVVAAAGGLHGLAAVITALARRNDGKKVVLKYGNVTGASPKAVLKLPRRSPMSKQH